MYAALLTQRKIKLHTCQFLTWNCYLKGHSIAFFLVGSGDFWLIWNAAFDYRFATYGNRSGPWSLIVLSRINSNSHLGPINTSECIPRKIAQTDFSMPPLFFTHLVSQLREWIMQRLRPERLMHWCIASIKLNNARSPFLPTLYNLANLYQLPEAAADHWCTGGPAHTGHPWSGDIGTPPERGTLWPHQLCGAAAETGNKLCRLTFCTLKSLRMCQGQYTDTIKWIRWYRISPAHLTTIADGVRHYNESVGQLITLCSGMLTSSLSNIEMSNV